jgi:Tol biopolymer transport system component
MTCTNNKIVITALLIIPLFSIGIVSTNQLSYAETFPGINGKFSFTSTASGDTEIYTVNDDGSQLQRLTFNPGFDSNPSWSPDGTKIAFTEGGKIWVMNADGSNPISLANIPAFPSNPNWSPDGTKMVFLAFTDITTFTDVYTINIDGTNLAKLTSTPSFDYSPSWSPDGTKIVFRSDPSGNSEIFTMNVDGSGLTNISNHAAQDQQPNWSPDGTKIAFATTRDVGKFQIWTMNADGSNPERITFDTVTDSNPRWSPDGTEIAFVKSYPVPGSPDNIYTTTSISYQFAAQTPVILNFGKIHALSWQPVLISSEISQILSNNIQTTALAKNVENSLLGPLKQISKILDDGNDDNNDASCDKLDEFIANVESKRDSGKLDPILAHFYIETAESLKDKIPC